MGVVYVEVQDGWVRGSWSVSRDGGSRDIGLGCMQCDVDICESAALVLVTMSALSFCLGR